MSQDTRQRGAHGLEQQGFRNLQAVNWNLPAPELYERAVIRGEGHIARGGALVALTGQHTGRSASDKFIVRDSASDKQVWWDNNKAMTQAHFDALFHAMVAYAQGRELFVQDLFGGADPTHRLPVRVVTELAWHSLFIQHLLIEPTAGERDGFVPEFTIIDLPGFQADPAVHGSETGTVIAVNFTQEARPDRRHVLCRRDEEIGVHDSQLSPAAQARDADALLGQCRAKPRRRDLFRALRHRQDDALRRRDPHAGRRRRAWLV